MTVANGVMGFDAGYASQKLVTIIGAFDRRLVALTLSAIDWQTVRVDSCWLGPVISSAWPCCQRLGLARLVKWPPTTHGIFQGILRHRGYLAGYFRRLTWPGFPVGFGLLLAGSSSGYVMECRRTLLVHLRPLLNRPGFPRAFRDRAVLGIGCRQPYSTFTRPDWLFSAQA